MRPTTAVLLTSELCPRLLLKRTDRSLDGRLPCFQMYARELRHQTESVKNIKHTNIKHTESHVQLKLEAAAPSESGRSLSSTNRTLSSQPKNRSLTADDLKRVGPILLVCVPTLR
jgi:adenine-specific DNA glycosylase